MKAIKAVGITATTLLMLTSSIAPARANTYINTSITGLNESNKLSSKDPEIQEFFDKQYIQAIKLKDNSKRIEKTIVSLKSYVGKTWYVFSGNTPSGWDCSGLTMWFYEQLGISLEHRATAQALGGTKVPEPKPGDIVAFHYENSAKAYHVGIYIGNGLMIHSPAPGKRTSIDDVVRFGGTYSDISYIRYIESI